MRVALLIACAFVMACGTESEKPAEEKTLVKEPDRIEVDHILIGVKSPRLPRATRSVAEAEELARKLLADLEGGDADWAGLKRRYSDDPPPGGPYKMSNRGVPPTRPGEYPREQMATAFGDVGFQLEVGGIGLAEYDPAKSPFGYHIIKRTK